LYWSINFGKITTTSSTEQQDAVTEWANVLPSTKVNEEELETDLLNLILIDDWRPDIPVGSASVSLASTNLPQARGREICVQTNLVNKDGMTMGDIEVFAVYVKNIGVRPHI
jgi:hypothetical protein